MRLPKSFIQLMNSLHDEKSCREFLETHRWHGVPKCPHCNHESEEHYRLNRNGEFNGLYNVEIAGKHLLLPRALSLNGVMFL